MAILITKKNKARHQALLKKIYRFRHEYFVEGQGWEDLRKSDLQEKDQFDDEPDVCHVVEENEAGIAFYSRLLPTTCPTILGTVYPELLEGRPAPRDQLTWEWTRGATRKPTGAQSGAADPLSRRFYISAFEAFLHLGISRISVQTHPIFMTRMLQAGHNVTPLCLPTTYKDEPIVAFIFEITDETLPRLRRRINMYEQVLEYSGAELEIDTLRASKNEKRR